jgi:uncharacterized UBP type Zn finger protein
MKKDEACQELAPFQKRRSHAVRPASAACNECLAEGLQWVHLRLCMSCGHIGCCDSSPGRHATGHFHATQHPVIKSFEPGEEWAWCYVHESMLPQIPSFAEESPAEHLEPPA